MKLCKIVSVAVCLFCFCAPAGADGLLVAAGAGYKRPLAKVYQRFSQESGITLDAIFGNMQQVIAQVERSGRIGVAIGDKSFLARSAFFDAFVPLGQGRLVIIFNKYPVKAYNDLLGSHVVYVADTSKQQNRGNS